MDITKIRLTGLSGQYVEFPIYDLLPSSPYILKAFDGLGPTAVGVSVMNIAPHGGVYQGRRPQNREAVFRVGLNPNYSLNQTAQQLRQSLYFLLMSGTETPVRLSLYEGNTELCYTLAHMANPEIVPFAKEPEVQLTFTCFGPYFEAPEQSITVDPGGSKLTPTFPNVGDAQTGFEMIIEFTAARSGFSIYRANDGLELTVTQAFAIGDFLKIDTRLGSLGVWIDTGSGFESIIDTLTETSDWIQLHGGNNVMNANTASYDWYSYTYTPRYLGI